MSRYPIFTIPLTFHFLTFQSQSCSISNCVNTQVLLTLETDEPIKLIHDILAVLAGNYDTIPTYYVVKGMLSPRTKQELEKLELEYREMKLYHKSEYL